MRRWGSDWAIVNCAFLKGKLEKVFEVGCRPLEWWDAEVVSIDQKEPADIGGRFEEYQTDEKYDMVCFVWSLCYSLEPMRAIRKAISILRPGGHLLIISRVYGHKFESPVGESGGVVWVPTEGFLKRLNGPLPELERIAFDWSDRFHCVGGLWRYDP